MSWAGLEYLMVPQWRTAFEKADVILGIDVLTDREILVFGRAALIASTGMTDTPRVLRISIDSDSDVGVARRRLRSLPRTSGLSGGGRVMIAAMGRRHSSSP